MKNEGGVILSEAKDLLPRERSTASAEKFLALGSF
jgi:hypothetical protein